MTQPDRPEVDDPRVLALAQARQQLAYENPFNAVCPPWDGLTEQEQRLSLLDARSYLHAALNAGLIPAPSAVVVHRATDETPGEAEVVAAIVAALQERAGELSELAEEEMRPSLEERAQEWLQAAEMARRAAKAAVGCAAVYAVTVTVWWPCHAARDALAGALAASRALRALGCVAEPHGAADGRTAARATSEGPSDGTGGRHSAPQASGEGFPTPARPGRPQTRSGPSWAQPGEEAA